MVNKLPPNLGQRNGRAKLTKSQVIHIRKLVNDLYAPQRRVAAKFGISVAQVSKIAKGERWAWVG